MKREQVLPHVMADMAARIAKGASEYGEPLTTNNGRDALQDAYEEALDLALYLKKAIMERKEVMQTEPVHSPAGSNTATAPAVSESAAGDWPGPDWSQAPEGAMWWSVDSDGVGCWSNSKPDVFANCYWALGNPTTIAPSFGYRGDWRASLRKRPA